MLRRIVKFAFVAFVSTAVAQGLRAALADEESIIDL